MYGCGFITCNPIRIFMNNQKQIAKLQPTLLFTTDFKKIYIFIEWC